MEVEKAVNIGKPPSPRVITDNASNKMVPDIPHIMPDDKEKM